MYRSSALGRPALLRTAFFKSQAVGAPLCPKWISVRRTWATFGTSRQVLRRVPIAVEATMSPRPKSILLLTTGSVALAFYFTAKKANCASQQSQFVTETASGVQFPKTIQKYDGHNLDIVACTVRTIFYLFQTYALGFYVDTAAVVRSAPHVDKDVAIAEAIFGTTVPKLFRITSVRDSEGSHTRDALMKAIKPFLSPKCSADRLDQIMRQFRTMFPKKLAKGACIDFVMNNGTLAVANEESGTLSTLEAPELCQAICEMYLGEKSKIPKFRKDVMAYLNNRIEEAKEH